MKVVLLITTFNRVEYLKECIWSLERADLSQINEILIIDDASTDQSVVDLIAKFRSKMKPGLVYVLNSPVNCGIKLNLLTGFDSSFKMGYDIVINLDSDAMVKPNCFNELLRLYQPNTLLTGFHSTTMGRHKILSQHESYCIKESVGGINFCIDKQAYENFVKPALEECITTLNNWDYIACKNAGSVMCAVPSLIQHVGLVSTLGHWENPDVADNFKYWELPDVTLIGVDGNKERLQKAFDICAANIRFGAEVLLNEPINSKEAYSLFCIKELYKHVKTSHLLICQYDGVVHNWKAWDNSWLQYDYIGAPWWYTDGLDVGNGGFSLRSRRLMEIVAKDDNIKFTHPEDHHICRTYRPYLEKTYGIKFAPREVAERFSFEGYKQPTKVLKDQFGKHGINLRTSPVRIATQNFIFNQFLSLGDILFLIPMARNLIDEGNTVLWPIDNRYLSIKKHFKDINFVSKLSIDLPYDRAIKVDTPYGTLLPYRFASELQQLDLRSCMRAKYSLYGHDYRMWRELVWERDYPNELKLKRLLRLPEKYNLVNRFFGHLGELKIEPVISNTLPIVEMSNIEDFTLIDWMSVIEGATEIHVANSAICYLLELSDIKAPIHLYKRGIWNEVAYEYSDYLWESGKFIYH